MVIATPYRSFAASVESAEAYAAIAEGTLSNLSVPDAPAKFGVVAHAT
jgi:hypothetical protein